MWQIVDGFGIVLDIFANQQSAKHALEHRYHNRQDLIIQRNPNLL